MRPLRSSGVETLGRARWCVGLVQGAPFAAHHLTGLFRYYRLGARGEPMADQLPTKKPQTDWIEAITERLERDLLMNKEFRAHNDRTWLFAHALARATPEDAPTINSGGELDDEAMYAACLLHDAGLFVKDRKRCFAMVGADLVRETARAAEIDCTRYETAAAAVASHIDVRPKTPFARLLRSATLVDVLGFLTWEIDPAVLTKACHDQPRTGFTAEVLRVWTDESDRFPFGRAAFAKKPGGMLKLTRFNPLDQFPSKP